MASYALAHVVCLQKITKFYFSIMYAQPLYFFKILQMLKHIQSVAIPQFWLFLYFKGCADDAALSATAWLMIVWLGGGHS